MFCGIDTYSTCSNAVFRHRHRPTIVLTLVYCCADDTLFEVGPEIHCSGLVTMADQQKVVYDLFNGAIFNDLERPLPPVSRSRHSLTLSIPETVRDTDIVSMKY